MMIALRPKFYEIILSMNRIPKMSKKLSLDLKEEIKIKLF